MDPRDAKTSRLVEELRTAILDRLRAKANDERLKALGGNLLIIVKNLATWTIVTDGPSRGLHEDATDDPVGFALICTPRLFDLVFGGSEQDLSPYIEAGELVLHGDVDLFERFMDLSTGEDPLSVRASQKRR